MQNPGQRRWGGGVHPMDEEEEEGAEQPSSVFKPCAPFAAKTNRRQHILGRGSNTHSHTRARAHTIIHHFRKLSTVAN